MQNQSLEVKIIEPGQSEILVCYVTCPNEGVAEKIANELVSKSVAACCNLIPGIKSIYSWEGKLCTDQEHLMIIKTKKANF